MCRNRQNMSKIAIPQSNQEIFHGSIDYIQQS